MNNDKFEYYQSKKNGLVMTLPGNLPNVEFKSQPTLLESGELDENGKPFMVAHPNVATLHKEQDKEVIEALRNTPAFKKGQVERMKTPKELAHEAYLRESEKFVDQLKTVVSDDEIKALVEGKKQAELFAFANRCGVSVKKGNANRTTAEVKKDLYSKLLESKDLEENNKE